MKSYYLFFLLLMLPFVGFAQGPTTAATAPTAAAEDVISMFSDAYDDVAVDTYLTDWSAAGLVDTTIDGTAMKVYTGLDFAGIETVGPNALDLTGMTHLHVDFWSAGSTTFRVKLVDFGGDGFMGDSADSEFEIPMDLAQGEWVSLDYPLTDFLGMNQSDINQFIISSAPPGMSDVYLDNIYFYRGTAPEAVGPTTAAPAPTQAAEDVISLFSDAYDDVTVDTYLTEWSSASLTDTMIAGTAMKRYSGLDFAGIEMTGANAIDLETAGMTDLHIDFWSSNSTTFRVKLVDFGGDGFMGDNADTDAEVAMDFARGEWVSVDYRLSAFAGMNQSDISQFIISSLPVGTSDVYLDNIYFFRGEAVGTQMDLPVDFETEDVDYGFEDFAGAASMIVADPEDAANTVVATTKTAGSATFAGTVLTSTSGGPGGFASAIPMAEGASTMSVRVWSPTAGTTVRLKIEQEGDPTISVETEAVTAVAGAWADLVFDFSTEAGGTAPVNYDAIYNKAVIFFDFGSEPGADATYYWDDMELGGTFVEVGPMTAAPTPTRDAADVISLFSDAYTNVAVDTFLTEWSDATLTDTLLEGNATLLYRNLAFAGIETIGENAIDLVAAGMTHLHLHFWSPNSTTFRTKLVDFGGDGFGGDNDTEFEIARDLPRGEWVSVEYPLPAFVGMNQSDINQFIISSAPGGASSVWIDNIYFYAGEPLGAQVDLPVTFEDEGVDYGPVDFGGASSMIVVDPEDATNTVVATVKTAGAATFAGTTITSADGGPEGFASTIPFSEGNTTMSVRVWSPTAGTPVRLKVEQSGDPTVSVETQINTTAAGAWETLVFDFDLEATGTATINFASIYNKASIFFDFGSEPTEPTTYYWDDVFFGGEPVDNGSQMDLPVTFEDEGIDYGVADFGGNESMIVADPEDATNTVVQSTKTAGAMTWGGTTLTSTAPGGLVGFASQVPFTATATKMSVSVWSPTAGTPVLLKVENKDDGAISVETLTNTTVAGGWEILVFDFSMEGAGTPALDLDAVYDKASIFFNFGTMPTEAATYYWDDVYFGDVVGTNEPIIGLLEAFPNPVGEMVNIVAPARMNELTLYNFSGQVVGNWAPNAEQFNVEMSQLPAGNYVALVSTDEGLMTIKLVKQ